MQFILDVALASRAARRPAPQCPARLRPHHARASRALARRGPHARVRVARIVFDVPRARATQSDANLPVKTPKPKRDMTNAVVVESIRRKKLAKGIVDARLPPPALCPTCERRFCRCEDRAPEPPRAPLESDCCASEPACKFCVKVVYEELLAEYEAAMTKRHA